VLLVVLHNNQAPDAEDVAATKLDRSPFEFHTHGAGVVIDLRNVAQDLGIDFSAGARRTPGIQLDAGRSVSRLELFACRILWPS
jgi:hypothetical protein